MATPDTKQPINIDQKIDGLNNTIRRIQYMAGILLALALSAAAAALVAKIVTNGYEYTISP